MVGLLLGTGLLVVQPSCILGRIQKNIGLVALNLAVTAKPSSSINLFDTAEKWLLSAERNIPSDRNVVFTSGYLELLRDRPDSAFTIWNRQPIASTEQAFQWGDKYRAERDLDKSLWWYQVAVELSPQIADTWYYIGLVYENRKEFVLAATAYQTALEKESLLYVKSGDLQLRSTAVDMKRLTSSDIAWDSILLEMDTLLNEDDFSEPFHRVQAHYFRGEALRHLGNHLAAINEYEWVVSHRPNDFWAYTHLGWLTWKEYGKLDDAAKWLHRAIEINPRSKWGYRILGDVYMEAGENNAAREMYHMALAIDPGDLHIQSTLQQLAE